MADTPHTPTPGSQPGTPHAGTGEAARGHGHDNPIAQLWMATTGASVGGHHEAVPGVSPQSAKVGHEPDQFNARTIVYVPILVSAVLVVTYLVVQSIFAFVNGKESQQLVEVPGGSAADNATRVKDPNAVAATIRPWGGAASVPAATPDEKTPPPVPQANLEYRQQKEYQRMGVDGKMITDPPFVRSTPPKGANNSPEIYPEDLRPGAAFGPPAEPTWTAGRDGKFADLPLEVALELLDEHDHGKSKLKDTLKAALKVSDTPAKKPAGTLGKPTIGSGGLTQPLPAKDEKKHDHDHK